MSEETTFYSKLQNCEVPIVIGIDLRDSRGKRHELCYVLLNFTISLLRGRDGVTSSIYRSMKHYHEHLCIILGKPISNLVSRSHLPIILKGVKVESR